VSLASTPADDRQPLLDVRNLTVRFPAGSSGFFKPEKKFVHAVEDVSFQIMPGETLGLVGESGSGKTTTGRAVLRSNPITSGSVTFRWP
jgi:peptide/nickel transport system ATP-binding protein